MKQKDQIEKQLEHELRKPLEFQLPMDFSDKVIERIIARNEVLAHQNNWLINFAIVGFALLSVTCLLIFTPEDMRNQMIQIVGWTVPLAALVGVFQYLDHKLVRKKVNFS